jgi:hypothetical protein
MVIYSAGFPAIYGRQPLYFQDETLAARAAVPPPKHSQQGREEVLHLGVKVVSISGAKGKKIIELQQWKSQPYRRARAERSAIESLVFTLKENFEFAEMVRRTHQNVLAEMLEKVLAYNISQIIRVRKKLSEPEEMERTAA